MKEIRDASDLTLLPAGVNPNKGTERGAALLDKSLEQFGAWRSITATSDGVVPAGNKTAEAWIAKGGKIRVVKTDGNELVVVQRTDLRSDDPRVKMYAVADNRVSEVDYDPDGAVMKALLDEGLPLEDYYFKDELEAILASAEDDPNSKAAGDYVVVTCNGTDELDRLTKALGLVPQGKPRFGTMWTINAVDLLARLEHDE